MERLSGVLWKAHINLCPLEAKVVDAAIEQAYDRVKDYLSLEQMIVGDPEIPIAHLTPENCYCLDPLDRPAKRLYYSFVHRAAKAVSVDLSLSLNLNDKTMEAYVQQTTSCCDHDTSFKRLSELRASYLSTYEMHFTVGFPDEILGPRVSCDNVDWIYNMVSTFFKHECVTHVPRFNFKLVFESIPLKLTEDLQRCIYDKLDGRVSYDASLVRIGLHSFAM
jgi:hypothetical protein